MAEHPQIDFRDSIVLRLLLDKNLSPDIATAIKALRGDVDATSVHFWEDGV